MKLIIGLGNPGIKYQKTRHNIGFLALDHFFDTHRSDYSLSQWSTNKKFSAEISEGFIQQEKIIIAKPNTFMNESGKAVSALSHYYKVAPLNIIIIHDDIDIIFGQYKIQKDVSSAGHNGIKSIIQHLKTQQFHRIRIGVGKSNKNKQGDTAKFVLNQFSLFEKLKLNKFLDQINEELLKLL
ncbi:aminoacyl-tRNA hydrolase [Candidatus Falkowbacteria bacterium CG10_big_fil_rev_8_21_14_0_10_39_11]|uniref:Peptidyl-tRNA hydrolase n=1 Tax=Candidatus Falkowbacteria bacterium CG10_big_fil_rev_8_21_14_0_10_39_11 TaxID=1974565 RepID=A0A2H0V595_9BACT|nr:MAG: aminoacyl-tRNA hydrolase [Candidatus Falkowbacteria bacterium CG10_big_fil_rev_8_21_14_0_10_39_11]